MKLSGRARELVLGVAGCLGGAGLALALVYLLPADTKATLFSTDHIYWYLSRASALAAYFAVWASVALGLLITSRTASIWPGGPAATSAHKFASLLGLGLATFHALILLGDQFIRYSVADVLVPFAGTQYEPLWVGVGQTGLYIGIVVSASWLVRDRIGYRAWRTLHYFTLAMFVMALAHGTIAGTDTQNKFVTALYYATGGSVLLALVYRLLAVRASAPVSNAVASAAADGSQVPNVTFLPDGKAFSAKMGQPLLDALERSGVKFPSGCRAGTCGLDPVYVVSGGENLTEVRGDEKATLARLGLRGNWRLACSAGVCGSVAVSRKEMTAPAGSATAAQPGRQPATSPPEHAFAVDSTVKRVVIIGNGVAGTTAADEIRRHLPDCAITIVSKEPRHFYNRMAIAKLIEGTSAPEELTIAPPSWYEERRIECLLGAEAARIDRAKRVVVTDRGRYLEYDRLLLAGGSDSALPPIKGWGPEGCFTLRDVDDAMAIRDYIRHHSARQAVVLGGGLLGLEAAHSLRNAGLATLVLDRNAWIMHRQVDEECGTTLAAVLGDLGIEVWVKTGIEEITGNGRIEAVVLGGGVTQKCDLLLASTGISPGMAVAADAGIEVRRGVLTDDFMRTSDPLVFAAGDIAEHRGAVYGLWGASAEQAKAAARNMAGANEKYAGSLASAQLKIFGVDFTSFGEINGKPGDTVIVDSDVPRRRYRKVIVRNGRIAGAVLLGYPELAGRVLHAARENTDVSALLTELSKGQWAAFAA